MLSTVSSRPILRATNTFQTIFSISEVLNCREQSPGARLRVLLPVIPLRKWFHFSKGLSRLHVVSGERLQYPDSVASFVSHSSSAGSRGAPVGVLDKALCFVKSHSESQQTRHNPFGIFRRDANCGSCKHRIRIDAVSCDGRDGIWRCRGL